MEDKSHCAEPGLAISRSIRPWHIVGTSVGAFLALGASNGSWQPRFYMIFEPEMQVGVSDWLEWPVALFMRVCGWSGAPEVLKMIVWLSNLFHKNHSDLRRWWHYAAIDSLFIFTDGTGITIYINSGRYFRVPVRLEEHACGFQLPDSVSRKVKMPVFLMHRSSPVNYMFFEGRSHLAYIVVTENTVWSGSFWDTVFRMEAIIDRSVAEKSGIGMGDKVKILGQEFEVAGLSEETSSLVNSVAFISMKDFEELRGRYDTFSFLLVKVDEGEAPQALETRIQAQVKDVTAETTRIRRSGRKVVKDMST
jgi:hypothetical protein